MIDGNSVHFLEIAYPDLVKDIQKEFEFINSLGNLKHPGFTILKTVIIKHDSDEYQRLNCIFDKYKFLKNHILIFNIGPGEKTPIHTDGLKGNEDRSVSINIPISGCTEECVTEFFDIDDCYMRNSPTGRSALIKAEAIKDGFIPTKVGDYCLISNPVLVDTQKPHRVNNKSSTTSRVSVSWTTTFTSWQDALDHFEKSKIS